MYEITFHISQCHIDKGIAFDSENCGIAQSASEYFGPDYFVTVYDRRMFVTRKATHSFLRWEGHADTQDFIKAFDKKIEVQPQTVVYTLAI